MQKKACDIRRLFCTMFGLSGYDDRRDLSNSLTIGTFRNDLCTVGTGSDRSVGLVVEIPNHFILTKVVGSTRGEHHNLLTAWAEDSNRSRC